MGSRLLVACALLGLAGCPYVPAGEVRVEQGTLPVAPGAQVSFGLYCDPLFGGWELTGGPGHCGRDWQVQGVTGGSVDYGTIDDCGRYTAPMQAPPEPIDIIASECPWGDQCTDACGALLTLELDGFAQVSARSAP